MDIKNGEILGMVSLPEFSPTKAKLASEEARFNKNTLGIYELGSVFKAINAVRLGIEVWNIKTTTLITIKIKNDG